jgi:hypothetical protein
MKTTILLFIFSIPLMLSAQVSLGEWAAIKPVTDSSHFNRNACLQSSYSSDLLFWDQELNATTTQLCYRSLEPSLGEVHVALTEPNVKLTHPKTLDLSAGSSSSDIFVFYQTNEGADIDLNYFRYQTDGTISEVKKLTDLSGDDINLSIGNSGIVAWENSGKIYVSNFIYETNSFTSPYAIDSVGAHSPVLSSGNVLVYLKPDGGNTTVLSKHIYYYQGTWGINDQTIKTVGGESTGLTTANIFGQSFAMQNKVGSNPSGLILFTYWLSDIEFRNSPTFNYTQPALADYMIAVKNSMNYFLAYVSDSLAQDEIFVEAPVGFNPGVQNISQWPGEDRNPLLFESFPDSYFIRVHLFWESERQGYSTIYYSYFDYIFGGTAENPKSDNFITAAPCPFDKETTISFPSSQHADVTIFDLQGRKVRTLSLQSNNNSGLQQATWDGTNQQGSNVPHGSYVVVVNSDNETHNTIVIKK